LLEGKMLSDLARIQIEGLAPAQAEVPGQETPDSTPDSGTPEATAAVEMVAKALVLERDGNGDWVVVEPAGRQTDQATLAGVIPQLTALNVLSTLDPAPEASATGLDQPANVITITDQSGQQTVIRVGKSVPTGSGYYVQLGEGGPVYVISRFSLSQILDLWQNPPLLPLPTATAEISSTVTGPEITLTPAP
jgi:hypothetical protein